MDNIEEKLSYIFNKKYCCFTGSGTTAIYLTLKALELKNKKVLFPAITCTNPVNAAIYAKNDVIFCDINLDDYTMSIKELEIIIKRHNIGVVVPTHLYGNRCNIKRIKNICKKYNVFVLEDAAQSVYLDENSDASIISFGHTKIFENNFGGGAVFTDNRELFLKIKKLKKTLNNKPKNMDILFEKYRKNYYCIVNSDMPDIEKYKNLYNLQMNSRNQILFNADSNEAILESLRNKESIIVSRKNKALLYQKYLLDFKVEKPRVNFSQVVPWRYSFLFKGNREKLLKLSRERGIDISSWYMSLDKIYTPKAKEDLVNADYLEKHIVNLWVDDFHTQDKIKNDIEEINNIMDGI